MERGLILKRNVDIHDVGNSALYLISDLRQESQEKFIMLMLVTIKWECQIQKYILTCKNSISEYQIDNSNILTTDKIKKMKNINKKVKEKI